MQGSDVTGVSKNYIDAAIAEIEQAAAHHRGAEVPTVFFGGGTPSLLPSRDLARIIESLRANFRLRADAEITIEVNPDSIYKPIERKERKFNKLFVPKSIESALPFKSKHKDSTKRKKESYATKRAVVMDAAEKKKYTFVQAVNTIRNEKKAKRKEKNAERRIAKSKEQAKKDEKLDAARKARKRQQHRADGKLAAARERKRLRGS